MDDNPLPAPAPVILPREFNLPRRLRRLSELANNLWWTWNPEADRLFRRLDADAWEQAGHNLALFLQHVPSRVLAEAIPEPYLPGSL